MLKRFEKKFKTKGHIRGTLFWCIQRKTERERDRETAPLPDISQQHE
jgi:hypothetical protein